MKNLLEKISNLKVLVIGDIMLDHYIMGDATRISPEAPVPVVAVENDKYVLGAAGNVALNVAQLGCDTEIIGKIGRDRAGNKLKQKFHELRISFDENNESPDIDTIVKSRVVVRGQQLCRIDRENKKQNYLIQDENSICQICEKIQSADAVILSDYAKGTFSDFNVDQFIQAAHSSNTFISIDPKPNSQLRFLDVSLMTPNKIEAFQLADVDLEMATEKDLEMSNLCNKIYAKHRPKNLVITLGSDGMFICENDKKFIQIPTYAREVFDVSGAGDTAIACLTLALAAGETLIRSAKFANIASGIVVSRHGTVAISTSDMLNCRNGHLLSI